MMDFRFTLLVVTAGINVVLAIVVYMRNSRSEINRSYSFLTLSTASWIVGLYFFYILKSIFWVSFFGYLAYISALGIGLSLLYFSTVFPYRQRLTQKLEKVSICAGLVIVILFLFKSNILVIREDYILWSDFPTINVYVYLVYSIYFLAVMTLAFSRLAAKWRQSMGAQRRQIRLLTLSIFFGSALGIYFNLILPFFGNFALAWLGPVFTLAMNGTVAYILFRNKK